MPTRRLPKEIATNHEKAVRAEYSRHWQAGWTAVMRCRARCAALRDDLVRILGDKQVLHRVIDLVRYAADASPYRLVPQVVVLPRTTADCRQRSHLLQRKRSSRDLARSGNESQRSIPIRRHSDRRQSQLVRMQRGRWRGPPAEPSRHHPRPRFR
jgi:hypothetical protein